MKRLEKKIGKTRSYDAVGWNDFFQEFARKEGKTGKGLVKKKKKKK